MAGLSQEGVAIVQLRIGNPGDQTPTGPQLLMLQKPAGTPARWDQQARWSSRPAAGDVVVGVETM